VPSYIESFGIPMRLLSLVLKLGSYALGVAKERLYLRRTADLPRYVRSDHWLTTLGGDDDFCVLRLYTRP
jgi:hypothetical protein